MDPVAIEWAAPVTTMEPDWVAELVLPYEQVVTIIEPLLRDPIVVVHWQQVKDFLGLHPEPKTVELANARWREFLIGVWKIVHGYWQRQLSAAAARRH